MPSEKILIVEDELIVANDLLHRLKKLDYQVVGTVETGNEAIVSAERDRPDLILMDIYLKGGMDGIETSRIIQERFQIPVIYLTAYSDDSTLLRAQLTEPYGYILKPFEEREIHAHIEMALYRKKTEKEKKKIQDDLQLNMAELEKLNLSLDNRVREEVQKNREKDRILVLQSRQAVIGEMVSDISHRWRQPINALGIIIQNLETAYQVGKLDEKYLHENVEMTKGLIQNMSRSIDEFRSFFRPSGVQEECFLAGLVEKASGFMNAFFSDHNISVEMDLDKSVKKTVYAGEYSQAVLIILANIRETFLALKTIDPKRVEIKLEWKDGKSLLTIRDNAGKIDSDTLDLIFEPDFSLREQGSCCGLYIPKVIVEENLKGTLLVKSINDGTEYYLSV